MSLPIIWVRRGGPRPVRLAGPGRCPLKAEISGSNPLRAMTNSFVLVAKHILWANRAHIARRNVCIPSHLLPNALSLVQRCQAIGVARRNRSALPLAHILVRIRNGADVWVVAGDSLSHGYGIRPSADSEADSVFSIRWWQPSRSPWRKSVRESQQADKDGAANAENNRCPRQASWKPQLAHRSRQVEPHLDMTWRRSPSVPCSNSVRQGLPVPPGPSCPPSESVRQGQLTT